MRRLCNNNNNNKKGHPGVEVDCNVILGEEEGSARRPRAFDQLMAHAGEEVGFDDDSSRSVAEIILAP